MTTKVLTHRQARWVEILIEYNFILSHVPSKNNPTDGLLRRSDCTADIQPLEGFVIPRPVFRKKNDAGTYTTIVQPTAGLREHIIKALNYDLVAIQHRKEFFDPLEAGKSSLPSRNLCSSSKQPIWTVEPNGSLLYKGFICIPDNVALKLDLLSIHHNSLLAGHQGISKTFELLSYNYYFLTMKVFVKEYVGSCDLCAHAKAS